MRLVLRNVVNSQVKAFVDQRVIPRVPTLQKLKAAVLEAMRQPIWAFLLARRHKLQRATELYGESNGCSYPSRRDGITSISLRWHRQSYGMSVRSCR